MSGFKVQPASCRLFKNSFNNLSCFCRVRPKLLHHQNDKSPPSKPLICFWNHSDAEVKRDPLKPSKRWQNCFLFKKNFPFSVRGICQKLQFALILLKTLASSNWLRLESTSDIGKNPLKFSFSLAKSTKSYNSIRFRHINNLDTRL